MWQVKRRKSSKANYASFALKMGKLLSLTNLPTNFQVVADGLFRHKVFFQSNRQ
jgi:hypothetical protein